MLNFEKKLEVADWRYRNKSSWAHEEIILDWIRHVRFYIG